MEITEIKQKLSIHIVLEHYHLEPDKHGRVCCPFHDDKTPSLQIYPKTNTFHCFGCGKSGDTIEFIQQKQGISKHEAILKAQELIGVPVLSNTNPQPKVVNKEKSQTPEERVSILTKIFKSFKNGLQSPISKKPKEYLESRNLNYDILEIGYNSGQFHHRGNLNETDKQACINTGLLIPYSGKIPNTSSTTYTTFAKDCIIFPLKDKTGNIVSLYGRSIINNSNAKHYYLKDRQGLYPGYPNPNTTKIILTEAIIDAATLSVVASAKAELLQYTILACYGTNGLTEEHKTAIKQLHKLDEVIFFFDGDKPGREGIKKYQEELIKLLPNVLLSAVDTPENEDVNSLSVAYEPEIFTHLLENRITLDNAKKKPFLSTETVLTELELQPEPSINTGKLDIRNPEFITYTTGSLQITILGGINLQQLDRLRITLKINRTETNDPLHSIRHTLDLYHSDYLEKFIGKASEQLETPTNTIKRAIAELIEQIEAYRLTKIESMKAQKPKPRELSPERYKRAIKYLSSPNLLQRTNADIGKTGVIGEETNRLLMYLVFTSRLREQPLHIISLGSSGTGKTYLQEKVSELIPEQDKLEITILSENAFYYFDRKELKHKLVLIEDMDGAQEVLYPLRELQSKRKISKTIPIKDSKGNLKTITLHVEGPISLAGTTTKERLFEDNSNRSLLIYIDNSPLHKEQIMEYQRRLSAGKVNTMEENRLKEFFKDMQTVLKPINIRNPYAEELKLPEYVFKPLRTNAHYLATIETVTFYHQYQREIQTDPVTGEKHINTTIEDIQWANRLLKDVLLAKADELNQALRNFYETLKYHVKASGKGAFYSKEIREKLRMNPMTVNRYTRELESRNFIKRTGGNKKAGFEYEITNWEEYTQLQSNINALDDVLNKLKSKYNISITKPDVILKPSETLVN
jgi:DNA primase